MRHSRMLFHNCLGYKNHDESRSKCSLLQYFTTQYQLLRSYSRTNAINWKDFGVGGTRDRVLLYDVVSADWRKPRERRHDRTKSIAELGTYRKRVTTAYCCANQLDGREAARKLTRTMLIGSVTCYYLRNSVSVSWRKCYLFFMSQRGAR
jgi:hypothetical protein